VGFSASGCCVLHRIAFPVVSEWYQNAIGNAWRLLSNEESFYALIVPGVRGDVPSLDRNSRWIPSMGRNTAEGIDEASG
jgi:hypothetical protein